MTKYGILMRQFRIIIISQFLSYCTEGNGYTLIELPVFLCDSLLDKENLNAQDPDDGEYPKDQYPSDSIPIHSHEDT